MTYTPDYINLSFNPDVLRTGGQKINDNFDDISYEIDAAIAGLAYQNPVISISDAAPLSPELGDRYIVNVFLDESDPWYGHIDEIAEYVDTDTWEFIVPSAGWCCTVLDEEQQYVYNDSQWNPLPVLVIHNDLSSLDGGDAEDGEYYHVIKDVYDALAGTGTPTSENKFVTADSLLTDITTHTHDGEITAQVNYADLDDIPSSFTPSSHSHSKIDITDFTHTHSKTDISDFAHASGHIKGTGDEVDGDKLDIDFNPSYYTPGTITEADNVDHLSAHLHGIDLAINGKSPTGHTHSYSAEDHDSTHITSGTDEIDGDKLDIDWEPSNYTPAVVTNFSDSVDNLTSHLKGIDSALVHNHSGTYAPLTDSKVPTANLGTGTADSTTYLRGDQTWAILASGNNFVTVTAGETLAKYDIVYINTSDSNKAYKAVNNGTLMQSEVLGMVTETGGIALNGTGQVIVNGTQTYGSWTWTPNKWLYLSSTSGALTQTLPTTNGQYAVPVAIALSATQIYIQPMTGWVVSSGENALGCKKVTFDESTGTVSILTPPANAVITQITVVVTNDAASSGGTIKVGTAGSDDAYMATTVVDLTQVGNHVYDLFAEAGASPDEIILTVTAGGQTFSGSLYLHWSIPNQFTGLGGVASVSFTQATSSPALITTLPSNVVVTRCTVVVDTAASAGSPTISIGPNGDADALFDETDCDLLTQGIYLYDPFIEQSGSVYATITPDSQSFAGRVYVQYMAVS